ncbi:hypothetical protein HYR54_15235 [Candidatus Acetothermia bacterium]|nr:hypothetical protein [Candidatus Acetothermia bacterium]
MARRVYERTQILDEFGHVLSETIREGHVEDDNSEMELRTRYARCEQCHRPITNPEDFRGRCDVVIGNRRCGIRQCAQCFQQCRGCSRSVCASHRLQGPDGVYCPECIGWKLERLDIEDRVRVFQLLMELERKREKPVLPGLLGLFEQLEEARRLSELERLVRGELPQR